jgi:hypothetical protein
MSLSHGDDVDRVPAQRSEDFGSDTRRTFHACPHHSHDGHISLGSDAVNGLNSLPRRLSLSHHQSTRVPKVEGVYNPDKDALFQIWVACNTIRIDGCQPVKFGEEQVLW